jgi:hypothetical protein
MRLLSVPGGILGLVVVAAVAVVIAVAVIAGGDHGSGNATPTPDTTSPEAVASRFFHWYASERNLGHDPMALGSLAANADVTRALVDSMTSAAMGARPGIDPMLCSGSIPHDFTIGKAEIAGTSASVTVGAASHPAAWRVELKQEAAVWRLNRVTCVVG